MIKKLISFFKGETPSSVKWKDVRREMLEFFDNMKVKFEITPRYYKVTSGKKTWYWKLEDGSFDGTSWDMKPSI